MTLEGDTSPYTLKAEGGAQPTGTITTTFTLSADVKDELTNPAHPIFLGTVTLGDNTIINMSNHGGISQGSISTTGWASQSSYIGNILPLRSFTYNGNKYYGLCTDNYSALLVDFGILTNKTVNAKQLKVTYYKPSLGILTETYELSRTTQTTSVTHLALAINLGTDAFLLHVE